MRKLSDYKGEEAIELWADLLEPLTVILQDVELINGMKEGKPKLILAKIMLKNHSAEVYEMLERIDPEPLDGLNILVRLISLLSEMAENESVSAFFGFAGLAKTDSESSGSVTEITEEKKK